MKYLLLQCDDITPLALQKAIYYIQGFYYAFMNSFLFTDAEKAVIDSVIQNFCCYSSKILEKFTHSKTPWLKTRGKFPADVPSNRTITKETIGDYFTAVKHKYNMLTPNDIENYAQIMFSRSNKSKYDQSALMALIDNKNQKILNLKLELDTLKFYKDDYEKSVLKLNQLKEAYTYLETLEESGANIAIRKIISRINILDHHI
jgi:hypothetical protein